MVCSLNQKLSDDVTLETSYTVTYNGEYVKKIYSVEKVYSTDETVLEGYKQSVEELYSVYDGLDYYDYEVVIKDGVLTSTADIDYEHVDMDEMIERNPESESIIKDGKVKFSTLEAMYSLLGATCEE